MENIKVKKEVEIVFGFGYDMYSIVAIGKLNVMSIIEKFSILF